MTDKTYDFITKDLNRYFYIKEVHYYYIYIVKYKKSIICTILCESGNDYIYIEFKNKKDNYEFFNIHNPDEKKECRKLINQKIQKIRSK